MYGWMDVCNVMQPATNLNVIVASDKAEKMEVLGRRPDYKIRV